MKIECINVTKDNLHEIVNDPNCYLIKRYRPGENCFKEAGECDMTPLMKVSLADIFAPNTVVIRITQ